METIEDYKAAIAGIQRAIPDRKISFRDILNVVGSAAAVRSVRTIIEEVEHAGEGVIPDKIKAIVSSLVIVETAAAVREAARLMEAGVDLSGIARMTSDDTIREFTTWAEEHHNIYRE